MEIKVRIPLIFTSFVAILVSACASLPERKLPLSEVQSWRIGEVKVAFADDALVAFPASLNSYVQREIKKEEPGIETLPIDPANPGRNAYAEKAMEIAERPQPGPMSGSKRPRRSAGCSCSASQLRRPASARCALN